ncbi:MAG: DUF3106 domain-containing protein [Steroidobacteraceae bacterium]
MSPLRAALGALLLLLAAATVCAQTPEPTVPAAEPATETAQGRAWTSLSAQQQQLLGRFQNRWDRLPPARQQALARGAARWLAMTPEQRSSERERLRAWQRLPQRQRALVRRRWQQFRHLTPEQQRAFVQNFRAFSLLPQQQRAQLRQRWLQATPQQRGQMLQQERRQRQMMRFAHPWGAGRAGGRGGRRGRGR